MIAGIIIAEDSTVVIRALGPTLGSVFGVSGTLSDPILTIKDAYDNTVASNDNFADAGVNATPD